MSKNYKNAMNKITVDEKMKNKILKNIEKINNSKEIEFNEHIESENIKIVKNKYCRNLGILAACCAIVIYTLNNKYIFDFHKFNRNSTQNTEIAFNESQDSNDTSKSRERIEADLKDNKEDLEKEADTSKSSRLMENKALNDNRNNNDPNNNNSINGNSNNEFYKENNEVNNNLDIIKENNYRNEISQENDYNNEQSKNSSITSEGNNINTNENKINQVEREITKYSGDMVAEASDVVRGRIREFKTLDELRKSIDFPIKTPKVQSESNEIKSIIMNSNKHISIEYENKDYSLIFKIENGIDEENLNKDQYKSEYESEKVININEKSVLLKGNNNIINIANWKEGNISFEIEAISEIKEEEIINIIKNIE